MRSRGAIVALDRRRRDTAHHGPRSPSLRTPCDILTWRALHRVSFLDALDRDAHQQSFPTSHVPSLTPRPRSPDIPFPTSNIIIGGVLLIVYLRSVLPAIFDQRQRNLRSCPCRRPNPDPIAHHGGRKGQDVQVPPGNQPGKPKISGNLAEWSRSVPQRERQ
ncbi:hypothetical protein IF1G_02796 [Cordyceps javanica]|uniref:Uncharacterized protein n=1 Tax=Cordyceps javanica TaxID=43265 RepID=A0A545VAF7_9HYPO|nr:hypothetical protein IF1G_02796 [Cordyceps javanica]